MVTFYSDKGNPFRPFQYKVFTWNLPGKTWPPHRSTSRATELLPWEWCVRNCHDSRSNDYRKRLHQREKRYFQIWIRDASLSWTLPDVPFLFLIRLPVCNIRNNAPQRKRKWYLFSTGVCWKNFHQGPVEFFQAGFDWSGSDFQPG